MLVRKPKLKSSNEKAPAVCSSDEQSSATCTRNTGDKNCQADKSAHIQLVKPVMSSVHMQSNIPAVPIQDKKSMQQIVPQEDDKNCQVNVKPVKKIVFDDKKSSSTICYKNPVCSNKKCQDTRFTWPVKPVIYMQSKEAAMQSSFQKKHVLLCSDKNCQSTRCYRKKSPARPMYGNDRNCQETKFTPILPLKPEMKNQVICSYPNHQENKLFKRTVNLPGNISRNVNISSVCEMARTVNLPILCEI